jgi:hypothetical protein
LDRGKAFIEELMMEITQKLEIHAIKTFHFICKQMDREI